MSAPGMPEGGRLGYIVWHVAHHVWPFRFLCGPCVEAGAGAAVVVVVGSGRGLSIDGSVAWTTVRTQCTVFRVRA